MIAVLRGLTYQDIEDACLILGIDVHDPAFVFRQEERMGRCVTPDVVNLRGHVSVALWLTGEQANLLPPCIDEPTPICTDYRSDELFEDEEGNLILGEYPENEVVAYDEYGNPIGTRMQRMTRIITP